MTNKEALNIDQKWTAEQARNDLERYLLRDEKPTYKAVALAMQALEKQIPKKPILDKEQTMRYVTTFTCPTCGKGFTGTKVCSYCYHCGQVLDWSDEE